MAELSISFGVLFKEALMKFLSDELYAYGEIVSVHGWSESEIVTNGSEPGEPDTFQPIIHIDYTYLGDDSGWVGESRVFRYKGTFGDLMREIVFA